MTHKIIPIPAFKDNYIWLMINTENATGIIVDPGEAAPVLKKLPELNIKLAAILVTHHHHDHTGGIAEILKHYDVPVFGPQRENINGVTELVNETSHIQLPSFPTFNVIDIPGHTHGHIAYYGNIPKAFQDVTRRERCRSAECTNEYMSTETSSQHSHNLIGEGYNILFCGDTLFTAGCGRLFEGTASQMFESLNKLANLPDSTLVYCGHEYTLANLRFAQAVEQHNPAILQRIKQCETLRANNLPTVPATLQEEKATNPFLRCDQSAIAAAAEKYSGKKLYSAIEVFSVLREWKNVFI
jgi:hydroxyacylglutathione hydrolase